MESKKRLAYVDIIKTIAMLWIVGYWHLRYTVGPSHSVVEEWWCGHVTNVFLGAFIFFSGFCLSKYKFLDFTKDTLSFYKKRLIRFYPLYVLSLLLFFATSTIDGSVLFFSLFGVSSYVPPQPETLWFFSMLISFYAVTPIILQPNNIFKTGGVILSLLVLILIIDLKSPLGVDQRFFWYFPLYSLGLIFGLYQISEKYCNIITAISIPVSLAVFIYMLHREANYGDVSIMQFVFILTTLMNLIWIVRKVGALAIWKPVLALTNSSMCAYLFHRHIYIILTIVYVKMDLDFGFWFTAITFVPICLLASMMIQVQYDKIVNAMAKKTYNFKMSKTIGRKHIRL